MKQNKTSLLILISAIALFVQGCLDRKGQESLNNAVVSVEVEKIKQTNGSESIAYSGTLEESDSYPLSFSSVGTVAKVLISEGEYVKKGKLLAVLDDRTYKNSYEMASATLERAEDAYRRLKPMYDNGNLPEIKFVEVQSALQQAKAAAEIAKKSWDDCRLYSPVSGIVGKRSIDPGMNTLPNLASITIVKIEKVFAKVAVSENEISLIEKGAKATIKVPALRDAKFEGSVEEIGVVADPVAHTYKVKIGVPNPQKLIKPGMLCEVNIAKESEGSKLYVPGKAVMVNEVGKNFIYVAENEKAVRKYVNVGQLLSDGIVIRGNVAENDLVIVAGQQKLVNNSNISIINR